MPTGYSRSPYSIPLRLGCSADKSNPRYLPYRFGFAAATLEEKTPSTDIPTRNILAIRGTISGGWGPLSGGAPAFGYGTAKVNIFSVWVP